MTKKDYKKRPLGKVRWLWLALALICLVCVSFEFYSAWEYQRRVDNSARLQSIAQDKIKRAYGLSKSDIADQLGFVAVPGFVSTTEGAPGIVVSYLVCYTDAETEREFLLFFDHDLVCVKASIFSYKPRTQPPVPKYRHDLGNLSNRIFHLEENRTELWGAIVWLIILLSYVLPRFRSWTALTLMAWSLSCVYIAIGGYPNPLTKYAISENRNLLASSALVAASLLMFIFGGYHDKVWDPFKCAKCGFNLTGNKTGACPECGELIPGTQVKQLGVELE